LTDRKIQINDRKTEKVISLSVYLQNKNDKDGKIVCQSFNFPVGAPFPYRVFINRKFLDVKSEILSLSNEDNRKIGKYISTVKEMNSPIRAAIRIG